MQPATAQMMTPLSASINHCHKRMIDGTVAITTVIMVSSNAAATQKPICSRMANVSIRRDGKKRRDGCQLREWHGRALMREEVNSAPKRRS